MVTLRPAPQDIRAWLADVPDPEIPVLSVIDLGIIRDIFWEDDRLVVMVAPTYSGCPATRVIHEDIRAALIARGIATPDIRTTLSPPWSSTWISAEGRARLTAYGIAPPRAEGRPAACPHCGDPAVELISQFGSTPCKSAWRCITCREPFDYFKCI